MKRGTELGNGKLLRLVKKSLQESTDFIRAFRSEWRSQAEQTAVEYTSVNANLY